MVRHCWSLNWWELLLWLFFPIATLTYLSDVVMTAVDDVSRVVPGPPEYWAAEVEDEGEMDVDSVEDGARGDDDVGEDDKENEYPGTLVVELEVGDVDDVVKE